MRAVIAEDSVVLREGLVRLLEENEFTVVSAVDNGDDLITAVREYQPDVSIVDVRMPPTFRDEGLRAAVAIRKEIPNAPIVVFSQYVEERYAAELIESGTNGVGYLLKDRVADVRDFVRAIKQVAGGGTVLDPEVVTQLVTRRRTDNRLDALTPREAEVLSLMAEGKTNAAIADQIFVSEGTVEKHIRGIFSKLELEDAETMHRRVLAVLTFLRLGEDER